MLHRLSVIILVLLMAGCSWPTASQSPAPPRETVPCITIDYTHFYPQREPTDTNLARDAGPAAVGVVGALVAHDPLFAVLGYFAGQVALRAVERGSDAEIMTEHYSVPLVSDRPMTLRRTTDGAVTIEVKPRPPAEDEAPPLDAAAAILPGLGSDTTPQPQGIRPQ